MAEAGQSTNIWQELGRAFHLLGYECECNARGDTERINHLDLAVECCERLLEQLPPGPGLLERLLALLALGAAQAIQGNVEGADRNIADALVNELQAYAAALDREAE